MEDGGARGIVMAWDGAHDSAMATATEVCVVCEHEAVIGYIRIYVELRLIQGHTY